MEQVSLFPFLEDLRRYNFRFLLRDGMAAVTTAVMALPQSMAYAVVADLPLQTGIYASIFGTFFGAVFGSSRHLVMGPTSAVAMLLLAGTSEIVYTHYHVANEAQKVFYATQVMIQLALLIGILQILAGVLKLGRLTQFASRSVILGYIAGVAIATAVSQLPYFLGMPKISGSLSVWDQVEAIVENLTSSHMPTLFLGLFGLIFLVGLQKKAKRVPFGAIMVMLSAFVVFLFSRFLPEGSLANIATLQSLGAFQMSWPSFYPMALDVRAIGMMLPLAFAITLLGILESVSIARVIAANSGQRPSKNQEIFALGMANMASGLFGGMPCSGSFSRSMMNYSFGAKTRVAALVSSIALLGLVYSVSTYAGWIPLTALAALIFVACAKMIDWGQLATCFRATRADALIVCATCVAAIFFTLDIAFYIGVVLSIVLYLRRAASPDLIEYTIDEKDRLHEVDPNILRVRRHEICILRVAGELFFGAVDLFQEGLIKIAEDATVKMIIVDMRYALNLDATACIALRRLHDFLEMSGRGLICCDISPDALRVLNDAGLVNRLGPRNLFMLDARHPFGSLGRAIAWARERLLLGMNKKEQGPVLPTLEAL